MGYNPGTNDYTYLQEELRKIREWLAELSQPSPSQLAYIPKMDGDWAVGGNIPFGATPTALSEITFETPKGYSQAIVTAVATLNVLNTTGAQITVTLGVFVYDSYLLPTRQTVPNNAFGSVPAARTSHVSGLSEGDIVKVDGRVTSIGNLPASMSNTVALSASVIWLR